MERFTIEVRDRFPRRFSVIDRAANRLMLITKNIRQAESLLEHLRSNLSLQRKRDP